MDWDPTSVVSGLGFQVVDARLAAPRGDAYTNAYLQRLEWEGRDGPAADSDGDDEPTVRASLDTAIPADNVGYKLLQKMGWNAGKGLGRNEDGACGAGRGTVGQSIHAHRGRHVRSVLTKQMRHRQRKHKTY